MVNRMRASAALSVVAGHQAAAAAPSLVPAVAELARQAAQGTVLYNDDTPARILKFTEEARAEALPPVHHKSFTANGRSTRPAPRSSLAIRRSISPIAAASSASEP